MKAVISNRIYLNSPKNVEELRKNLTYKIPRKFSPKLHGHMIVDTYKSYKMLPNGIMSIPQCRTDLIPEDYEVIDKRILVPTEFPEPTKELFENQREVFNAVGDSCIINAKPGWGKTFSALHIARKLGQKTLIIVHTLALRDQWINEVKILYGIEPGVISANKIDVDSPIVITNIQTFIKLAKNYIKMFGTLIIDECHHCPSKTFTHIINDSYARFRVGLSATLIRKDGKHIFFPDYFGHTVHVAPEANTLTPKVKILRTDIKMDETLNWAQRVTNLCKNPDYIVLVAGIAKVQMKKGHQVLVISDRVDFIKIVAEIIGKDAIYITGAEGDRDKAKQDLLLGKKKCIVGSRAIFSEGISINSISSVILATPINNDSLLEQIIGRAQRKFEGKLAPEIIDINFTGPADYGQNRARLGFYLNKGWEVETL